MDRLYQALEKILTQKGDLNFEDTFQLLPKKLKKDLDLEQLGHAMEQFLLHAGDTMQAVSSTHQKVVTRQSLFSNCSFRIQLTPQEFQEQQLILGHRFIPFIHPGILVEQLHFFEEKDNKLSLERSLLPLDQSNHIFFNLLPPYGIEQYIESDDTSQLLNIASVDLKDWFKENAFKPEDQLVVFVKDYEKLEFYIEKISSREINSLRITDQHYNKQLTEAIYHVFDILEENLLPIDIHLFWAFAQMSPALIENSGPPFGPFISQHESLTFFQEGPFAFLQRKNFMEELMESARQYKKDLSPETMGKATDLDGVFQELGNSFTALLLRASMVEQLLEWDEIHEEELIVKMFADEPQPFFNAQQEKNFDQAFAKLLKSVKTRWDDQQLALPHLQLLRKATQFKMEIIYLLRQLNDMVESPDLSVQAIFQLQPIDQSLDQILENILSEQPMPYKEAQTLVKQLENGRNKFRVFRDELMQE